MKVAKDRKSDSYVGTINLDSREDKRLVKIIRSAVKIASNNECEVRLMGRGANRIERCIEKGVYSHTCFSYLPLACAETADIYIYTKSKVNKKKSRTSTLIRELKEIL